MRKFSHRLFLIAIASSALIFSSCAARNLARRDVVAQQNVAQLAGIHLSMIDEFTENSEIKEKPSLNELTTTCRHGRQLFRQALFYAENIGGSDNTRIRSLGILRDQFQSDCDYIGGEVKEGKWLSPEEGKQLTSAVLPNYQAALEGEQARNEVKP